LFSVTGTFAATRDTLVIDCMSAFEVKIKKWHAVAAWTWGAGE
jgi:hypothetical protein